jgi:dTDP-L-rhamnose 4-epimerase
MRRILITGGAGFIGSHLTDLLLERGYSVRILDSLSPQVHGEVDRRPSYLTKEAELVTADIRDPLAVRRALEGVEAVVHLAAAVGVGQSMYKIADYTGINDLGTAVLLEALINHPIERLVVASSMSVYGEGLGRAADGSLVEPAERKAEALRRNRWEPEGPDGKPLQPVPTPETKHPTLSSVYALNKYTQERLCLIWGQAYGVPTTALRFFNVYGTRQALSNPYTGVLAIFASRLLNGRPPMIFEDGQQRRDFVHVEDVAQAFALALEHEKAPGQVYNVGSGQDRTVNEVAQLLAHAMNRTGLDPEITGKARLGDIRHCIADISKITSELGYAPRRDFSEGLAELAGWVAKQEAQDRVHEARKELEMRGLVA